VSGSCRNMQNTQCLHFYYVKLSLRYELVYKLFRGINMSKAILLLISFLWINIIPLQAEPNRINKIQADLDIIASFSAEYPDSAAFLLKDILFQAAQSNNDSLTAKSHYELAKAYYFNAYYELSSNHFQYALKSNYALENSQFRGRCLNNIGVIEDILGNYALAIDYYLKSLDIDRQKGDSLGVAYSQVNIGLLYTSMKQLELAESILFLTLTVRSCKYLFINMITFLPRTTISVKVLFYSGFRVCMPWYAHFQLVYDDFLVFIYF
jgi:tetratricopeptide (TPR) repeat protein